MLSTRFTLKDCNKLKVETDNIKNLIADAESKLEKYEDNKQALAKKVNEMEEKLEETKDKLKSMYSASMK